jgi:photosystem II stability/assembly factor-like uncharacterized protein
MQVLKPFLLFALLISFFATHAQYKIQILDSNTFQLGEGVVLSKISFRGLSVVDDNTIWVSGSRGTIARSIDGGKTFTYTQLKGYEKSDFRDIEAFDEKRAIIMSSGTPALIMKTTDGGQTWKEVFRQNDSAYFLDAMDFWDEKRGMLVGDPINRHFVLLQTTDGGETWQELDTSKTPKAMDGEAVFAASGTSLRCINDSIVAFATGGSCARIFYTNNHGNSWSISLTKVVQGKPSQGIFSISLYCIEGVGIVISVGGDYMQETMKFKSTVSWNTDKRKSKITWNYPTGYKSCVENLRFIPYIIVCGTSGVEMSSYKKPNYFQISSEPFHVVRKAKNGKAVFLAGPNGKIGKLIN